LLRRLSVFIGGWSLVAAEQVCHDDQTLPEPGIVDALTNLVTKSLVIAEHTDGPTRYRLLETVRAYAWQQLAISDETLDVQ
jgi:predicted ATPase